jgi:putative transposase
MVKAMECPPEPNVGAPVLDPTRTRAHQGGIAERKAMIERDHALPITRQAQLLGMSRGTVYYMPRPTSEADLALMRRIDELHLEYPFMGARQLRRQLQREGVKVGRRHIGTLMQRMGIEALAPQPGTSKRAPGHKIYPYLLRKLAIARSNQVWALDTTYIPMARGFVYLTAVVDVASRRVLAHKVAITLEACHAREVIELAFARWGTPDIVNTDQGSQFTATEFTDAVLAQGCQLSMDGRGAWRDKGYVSHCTSFVRSRSSAPPSRRRRESLAPCILRGASSRNGSYRDSFLSL